MTIESGVCRICQQGRRAYSVGQGGRLKHVTFWLKNLDYYSIRVTDGGGSFRCAVLSKWLYTHCITGRVRG